MRLYINGALADLSTGTVIAQTKEVNDIANIETRNSNYTNSFELPKTAANKKIFEFMNVITSTTNLPYRKVEVSLYADSGECFIYKGYGIVTDKTNTFSLAIVDGVIDLYKRIENATLGELPLSELTHLKDIDTVTGTWEAELPYRYILADYNGKTGNTNITVDNPDAEVNIDYLIPSVNVSWLWERMRTYYGFTFNGAVFDTFNFKNLWMTYPKGILSIGENNSVEVFKNSNMSTFESVVSGGGQGYYFAKIRTGSVSSPNDVASVNNGIHIHVAEAGNYKVNIKLTLNGYQRFEPEVIMNSRIALGKNCDSTTAVGPFGTFKLTNNTGTPALGTSGDLIAFGVETELESIPFQLEQFDSICLGITKAGELFPTAPFALDFDDPENVIEISITRLDPTIIDFSDAFVDFSTKDFVTEIVQRFGLTIYKDKYTGVYSFYTLQEIFQNSNVYDWSDKFHSVDNIERTIGSYAKQNHFRYTYNDKESTHKDSFIAVNNENIEDTRDLFVSKIYAPEKITALYLDENTNVYKVWDREPTDDATDVKYTALDKRYFFMRSDVRNRTIQVYSEQQGTSTTSDVFYRESFYKLDFYEILAEYYDNIYRILNKAILVNTKILLNDNDVTNIDFTKPVFIKQLSNYFLINKINQYVPGKLSSVQLTRLLYNEEEPEPEYVLTINNVMRVTSFPEQKIFKIYLTINYDAGTLVAEYSLDGMTWVNTAPQDIDDTGLIMGIILPVDTSGLVYFRVTEPLISVASNIYTLVV